MIKGLKHVYGTNFTKIVWFPENVHKPRIPLDFETKLVFPEGWGSPTENLPWEGYGYFLDPHNYSMMQM